jgi:hypothetical protein
VDNVNGFLRRAFFDRTETLNAGRDGQMCISINQWLLEDRRFDGLIYVPRIYRMETKE